jgi:carboxypeptidase PM20D1
MKERKFFIFLFIVAFFVQQTAISMKAQVLALATEIAVGAETPDAFTMMQYPELFLQTYVRIPSVSGHEKQAGSFLASTLETLGMHVELLGDQDSNYNVAASLFPLSHGKPNIILLSHIDVVSAGEYADWLYPPFSGAIADGYLWGRGSFDNKASTIMQAVALCRYAIAHRTEELPFNVTILAVSGEENDSYYGAKYITDHYLEYLNPVLVLGEGPAGLRNVLASNPDKLIFPVAIANKRELWLTLRLAIDSHGHGSIRPGRYAIQEMIQSLQLLNQHQSRFQINAVNAKLTSSMVAWKADLKDSH